MTLGKARLRLKFIVCPTKNQRDELLVWLGRNVTEFLERSDALTNEGDGLGFPDCSYRGASLRSSASLRR